MATRNPAKTHQLSERWFDPIIYKGFFYIPGRLVSQISEPLNCMEILPILILVDFVAEKMLVDDMELVGNSHWMIPPRSHVKTHQVEVQWWMIIESCH